MAAPLKNKNARKANPADCVIHVRVTGQQKQLIKKQAEADNLSVSAYILSKLLGAIIQ